MNYDNVHDGNVSTADISCAFGQVRDSYNRQTIYQGYDYYNYKPNPAKRETDEEWENRLWKILCEILTYSETRPVMLATKQNETKMRELLEACPYVELLSEVKSRHGNYKVQLWFVDVHSKGNAE